mgnify:CR=1 FL=1
MIRSEILRDIAPVLCDHLVICNIGLPSQELHMIDDQPTNFYMLGTMGLSSSIGLGLALAQPKTVISIDGDGSVLTNLGTLPTIANNVADNYILMIIDNGSYGSTGDQPTYAGKKTKLKAVETEGYLPVLVLTADPALKVRALNAGGVSGYGGPATVTVTGGATKAKGRV